MRSYPEIDPQQMPLFPPNEGIIEFNHFEKPKTYTGLAGFHKYWGKKPIEVISYLIENLTEKDEIVMDPFLGSGLISRECLIKKRRFIGIDINPFSIEYASFLLDLPSKKEYKKAFIEIENAVSEKINHSYQADDSRVASHYLWENDKMTSVWITSETGREKIEVAPSKKDYEIFNSYQDYSPKNIRDITFFTNSRINVNPSMTLKNIFTGRAIRNIDLLIEVISGYPQPLKRALLLTLTSAAGQMSNMVFAIKNRGKENKRVYKEKIEVGSWVIGYWLPETHFEINVWNCYKLRAKKLLRALPNQEKPKFCFSNAPFSPNEQSVDAWLVNSDCRETIKKIPSESVSFVCTDPPHSDRIPYLELSELWNALLGKSVDFDKEIVVSNAKERQKSKDVYSLEMTEFFIETCRALKKNGYIALYFNARDGQSWQYIIAILKVVKSLIYCGYFPINYSATSVVQDNRKGAMKNDYMLIFRKMESNDKNQLPNSITDIPGWSFQLPERIQGQQDARF